MKALTTLFLLVLPFLASSQKKTVFNYDSTGEIILSGVISVDSATSAELLARAKYFVASEARGYDATAAYPTMKLLDRYMIYQDSSTVESLFRFDIHWWAGVALLDGTIKIEVKDGKYRYKVSHIMSISANGSHQMSLKELDASGNKPILSKLEAQLKAMEQRLKTAMQTSPKKETW